MKPVYLAQPYSHRFSSVRQDRYRAGCKAAADLSLAGVAVFSPIAHSHPIADDAFGATEADYWQPIDDAILRICSVVVVLMLPDWENSVGVRHEIALAEELKIPVVYAWPNEVHKLKLPNDAKGGVA